MGLSTRSIVFIEAVVILFRLDFIVVLKVPFIQRHTATRWLSLT